MEFVLSWVKSGLLFGVIASVVLMLSPNKAFQKHISFVVGLLFLLVMLHPLMTLFSLDERTYLESIKNYLQLENQNDNLSYGDLELYEQSLALQVKAALVDAGYAVCHVEVAVNENGQVEQIDICFEGTVEGIEHIDNYLKNAFGEGVVVQYEN